MTNTRIAFLETQVDFLETELTNLNEMLISCGFPEGTQTLKSTVQELLAAEHSEGEIEQI